MRYRIPLPLTVSIQLTDGTSRTVGVFLSRAGEMVELEDCYELGVVRASVADVRARQRRAVTPSPRRLNPPSW